jgi:hypothetical protein
MRYATILLCLTFVGRAHAQHYTIEMLSPFNSLTDIVGLSINADGDVIGWADSNTQKAGFLWEQGARKEKILNDPNTTVDCEPGAIDNRPYTPPNIPRKLPRVFMWCHGPLVVFDRTYTPLNFTQDQLYHFTGAAGPKSGDSIVVGYSAGTQADFGVRLSYRKVAGIPERLDQHSGDRSSIALAVNQDGKATGGSSFLSVISKCGEFISDRLGRAVYWKSGSAKPETIPAPTHADWVPQVGRAINDGGDIVGSTSPVMYKKNACYRADPCRDAATTLAFVYEKGASEPIPLPGYPNDDTMTNLTPWGINNNGQIVGNRDGIDCGSSVTLSGSRALLWQKSGGKWGAPQVLDKITDSPCDANTEFLTLTQASAINDKGQITGRGFCTKKDGSGNSSVFAFRLTPK